MSLLKNSNTPILVGICLSEEKFEIEGINVWAQKWKDYGITSEVIDPKYKEPHVFQLYSIMKGDKEIKFLAGEFSNAVWGFYWPPASL
jgi:hypothetical protein